MAVYILSKLHDTTADKTSTELVDRTYRTDETSNTMSTYVSMSTTTTEVFAGKDVAPSSSFGVWGLVTSSSSGSTDPWPAATGFIITTNAVGKTIVEAQYYGTTSKICTLGTGSCGDNIPTNNLYSEPGMSEPGIPPQTIAGIVVGVGIMLLLIGILALHRICERRRKARKVLEGTLEESGVSMEETSDSRQTLGADSDLPTYEESQRAVLDGDDAGMIVGLHRARLRPELDGGMQDEQIVNASTTVSHTARK